MLKKTFPPIRKNFRDYSNAEFILLKEWLALSSKTAISLDFSKNFDPNQLDQLRKSSIRLDRIRLDDKKLKESNVETLSQHPKIEFRFYVAIQILNLLIAVLNPALILFHTIAVFLISFIYMFLFLDIYINRPMFRYLKKKSILRKLKIIKKNTKLATQLKCYGATYKTHH